MQQQALGCVQIARANVRLATQVCGTADRASLERTLNLLETTAAPLRQAEAELRSGPLHDPAGLRREIALLKREITGMLRIIDGCAAVCRGLSMRLGGTALAYTPQGRMVIAPSSSAACELQG
jgi:hypothetical protein